MRGEVLLAVGRIRACWPVLTDSMVLPRERAQHVTATPERLAYLARQHTADRAALQLALRDGRKATGPIASPVRPSILDARALVDRTVSAVAAELHRAVTGEPMRTRAASTDARVILALDVIAVAAGRGWRRAGWLPAALAVEAADQLGHAADVAERAASMAPAAARVPDVDCPVCGLRSIRVRLVTGERDQWVAYCDYRGCVCLGPVCPCGRLDRVRTRRHVWMRDEWPTLKALQHDF